MSDVLTQLQSDDPLHRLLRSYAPIRAQPINAGGPIVLNAGQPGAPGFTTPEQPPTQPMTNQGLPAPMADQPALYPATPQSAAPQAVAQGLGVAVPDQLGTVGPRQPTLPAGSMAPRPVPPQYQALVQSAAQQYGVPLPVAQWVLQQESGFNPTATGIPTSGGRAQGIAQLMPATARELGVTDPNDPNQAIPAAMKYLRQLYDETGNWETAVQRYGTFSTGRGPEADNLVRRKFQDAVGVNAGSDPGATTILQESGTPYGDQVAGIINRAQQIGEAEQKETTAALAPYGAMEQADLQRVHQLAQQVRPPDLQQFRPQLPPENAVREFGSLGSVFAVLASAFTRRPMLAAMNGLAGSINALHQGDMEEYNRQFQAFQENTSIALKNYEVEHQQMDDALRLLATDQSAAVNAANLVAAKYGNQWQSLKLQEGMIHDIFTTQFAQQNSALKLQDAQIRLSLYEAIRNAKTPQERQQAQQAMDDYVRSQSKQVMSASTEKFQLAMDVGRQNFMQKYGHEPDPSNPDDAAKLASEQATAAGLQVVDQSTVESVGDMVAAYKLKPPSGWALRTPFWIATMNYVNKKAPGYAEERYDEINKSLKDFSTGKQGEQIRFIGNAIGHLGTLQQMSDALNNGNIQLFNKLSQDLGAATGNPAPTNFDAARQIVGKEIVRSIIATGGGVTERREAESELSRSLAPQQIAGEVTTFKQLLARQLGGLQRQYEQSIGRWIPEGQNTFLDQLPPDARSLLQEPTARGEEPTGQEAATVAPAAKPDAAGFVVGKHYTDSKGNGATYLGNGQWRND